MIRPVRKARSTSRGRSDHEPGSPISELIQRVPHIAFEVDDLDEAIVGKTLLGEPTSPMDGVRVAMILHNGMPVELLQFDRPE